MGAKDKRTFHLFSPCVSPNSPLENYKVIFRRNNGANEGNNSPPATQWIGGTMVPMRAIYQVYLIIAECSPLKT